MLFSIVQERVDLYEPGVTPLMFAAYSDHHLCVNAWIRSGADVNIGNGNGDTALIHAAKRGSENV